MQYRNATFASVKQENPSLNQTDLSKKVAEMWKDLAALDKEPYQRLAEEDKLRYEDDMATYTPSGDEDDDDEDDETLDDDDDDGDNDSEDYGRTYKKQPASRGPPKKKSKKEVGPKRPLNAYLIFVNRERDEVVRQHPTWPITEVVRHLGREWKLLGDEDKKIYNDLAAEDRDRYEREVKAIGSNSDLV